jgi:hypothetical protein
MSDYMGPRIPVPLPEKVQQRRFQRTCHQKGVSPSNRYVRPSGVNVMGLRALLVTIGALLGPASSRGLIGSSRDESRSVLRSFFGHCVESPTGRLPTLCRKFAPRFDAADISATDRIASVPSSSTMRTAGQSWSRARQFSPKICALFPTAARRFRRAVRPRRAVPLHRD